ncbi:MAG: carbohydrate-binding domain-containing protein, partial [Prevotella sp.]|nr:carbohydrate-binding domain-containing protein [Prevotella sp.]
SGGGSLTVTGNCRHGFACDDYLVINDEVSLSVNCTTGNGIKVNDGIWINGGTLDINVTADAARGIRCDSVVVITGGNTAITTSGNCVYDSEEADYSSAACIKCDYPFTMTGGTLTMNSSGDGGKGLNCSADILFEGGTLLAVTTGGNKQSKPKAVKSDTGIYISGGSFTAKVNKSWACDNGYDDDSLSDEELAKRRVTITGTPSYADITQKSVVITF